MLKLHFLYNSSPLIYIKEKSMDLTEKDIKKLEKRLIKQTLVTVLIFAAVTLTVAIGSIVQLGSILEL